VTSGFSVNGMRNQSNNFLLDGATNNDTFNTGFVMRPPPDAIQEFKIQTHSYSAEYGRNAGSVVNVVTKAGTNELRGSAWEFNRDDALHSRNFFAPDDQPKPKLKQNQFGGSLGGPDRPRPGLRLRLLRRLSQHARRHDQPARALRRAADGELRQHHDPGPADRPAVPEQHHPAGSAEPDRARS
jgi:outer membrane receptor protein involved in Fe transport